MTEMRPNSDVYGEDKKRLWGKRGGISMRFSGTPQIFHDGSHSHVNLTKIKCS